MAVIKAASGSVAAAAIVGSFLFAILGFGFAIVAEVDAIENLFPTHALALLFFSLTIPVTYQAGGLLLYNDMGWAFWQPGYGGARFVALNGIAWTFYPMSLIAIGVGTLSKSEQIVNDAKLVGGATGLLSYIFMVCSLLVYHPARYHSLSDEESLSELKQDQGSIAFNLQLQKSALMHNGEGVSGFWWLFVGMQIILTEAAAAICYVADTRLHTFFTKSVAVMLALWMIATATSVTHAMGGMWKHIGTSYRGFQPCKGGFLYILLQIIGWCITGLSFFIGLVPMACGTAENLRLELSQDFNILCDEIVPLPLIFPGILGLVGEMFIVLSLFTFQDRESDSSKPATASPESIDTRCRPPMGEILIDIQFGFLNFLFGPRNVETITRTPNVKTIDDFLEGENRWKKITAHCKKTEMQYLVIGVGFLGKRLVNRLLERGEKKIRLFDLSPVNPFEGDSRVEYVRGDVTKLDQIQGACKGVNIIYCTFAIIRFMDRLDHQAPLSYRINVTGTEQVIKAAIAEDVEFMIVTSSSHATTDEHSLPRLGRTEDSPYVTRETAHNHYGWTKAIADQLCLKANGAKTANGKKLLVSIVRPCSGIFGGDDRFSFEKALNMTIYPVLGAKSVCDWVHVENVVLGHILCEAALLEGRPNVAGEAFNVSNNEAYTMEDFWWSVKKIHRSLEKVDRAKTTFRILYIPESPLWVIAHISELNQWLFRGRFSLGADIDMLTPAALSTATMTYSYTSDKAKKFIGYEPAYTVDESIQKSFAEYYAIRFPEAKKTR